MGRDNFLENRKKFASAVGFCDLYEYIDQFSLYAGMHTIGSKLFVYDLFKMTTGIPGDIVEFGCWKGSNLLFLAKLKALIEPHSPKKVIGFDNFCGLPNASANDGEYAKQQSGKYAGDEYILRKAISLFNFDNLVNLVVGDARKTIKSFYEKNKHEILSFAYIDFDLYEPTRIALDFIDDCLSIGGVIVFDEACMPEWPGETLAMKEFLKATPHHYKMISNVLSRQPTVALVRTA